MHLHPIPCCPTLSPRLLGSWKPRLSILRLFLGISFLMAGLDKLGDPGYLDPSAPSYIGNQITQMAVGTPIEGFLIHVAVPNSTPFGVMVMGGELCIGVATLLGLLTRFSAIMGLSCNLTFFLSATWTLRPFYFGADLPYMAAWLSLALLGPGSYALDVLLARWLAGSSRQVYSPRTGQPLPPTSMLDTPAGRRTFVTVASAGVAGFVLAASGVRWIVLHPGGSRMDLRREHPSGLLRARLLRHPRRPLAGQLIAAPNSLPVGHAVHFKLPTGDPAILVHDLAGYSAYVALCTHQGCQVSYIARNNLLSCPCHGAIFDPDAGGAVMRGPTREPLSQVAITVSADGAVYLSNS